MKKKISELIQINTSLATPVYKQIVQSICRNIENGTLVKDDVLPSVNKISEQFSLARGSVFTAYNDLRASGIIDSIPGKGYFVSSTETKQAKRIFLLFSALRPNMELLFTALRNALPINTTLDIFYQQPDAKRLETVMAEQAGYYNSFILVPEAQSETINIPSGIDPKRIFVLGVGVQKHRNDFSGVLQNFEKDLEAVLGTFKNIGTKYKRMSLVVSDTAVAKDMASGFRKFLKSAGMTGAVRGSIEAAGVEKGDALIVVDDNHLVDLVALSKARGWKPGRDIGILSYNEKKLKSLIGEGISTISTDFEVMGKAMADMVMHGKREVIENPVCIVDRKSF